ncbi:MAG: efflux RND transporter permease subunit, partial [Pirellulales bacterium]|nr:efflux RND transporter permease subunit [Pirellulales bacterium]
ERDQAVLLAAPQRLRPVLMTAFSLILGLLPVALATGGMAESRAAMAILTIGGMTTSTFLTLLVVPVVYSLFDAATERLRSAGRRLSGSLRRQPIPPPEAPT